jgi:tetraacyldisaccharide 4'-kinase
MRAPGFYFRRPGLAAFLLLPFAMAYGAAASWRMRRSGSRASVPVICVGNPTLGGAGKTPAAIAIAQMLAAMGERPVFLSRGYGGGERGPVRADPARHSAREVGDEPLLLAGVFPTIVARDRVAGATLAAAQGASVIVMDDGFQNPALVKDLSLLMVDAATGIGNGDVFPAGPLRAPLHVQLAAAQALVRVGRGEASGFVEEQAKAAGLKVLAAELMPDPQIAARLKGKPLLAFAGIGHPEKFFATLRALGATIAECARLRRSSSLFVGRGARTPGSRAEPRAHARNHRKGPRPHAGRSGTFRTRGTVDCASGAAAIQRRGKRAGSASARAEPVAAQVSL